MERQNEEEKFSFFGYFINVLTKNFSLTLKGQSEHALIEFCAEIVCSDIVLP